LLGGGLGVHAVKAESTRLDLYAGAGYDWENFATRGQDRLTPPASLPQSQARLDRFRLGSNSLARKSWELIVGDEFTRQISDAVSFQQRMAYYPNLSESGEYRMAFDASIATKINRWLEWQMSFTDRYLSNPLPGIRKNDVLLTTGLRFTFGNGDQATYQGL